MRYVYKLVRTQGMYPLDISFHRSLRGAYDQAKKEIASVKKSPEYIKRTMKIVEPDNRWREDRDNQNINKERCVGKWQYEAGYESNNENGHEYWDDTETIEIIRIELVD